MIGAKQFDDNKYAGFYNVGPDDCGCVTTGDLADMFCRHWGEGLSWVNRSDGGPHEAGFLKLDCSKLKRTFGWRPVWSVETAVEKTVEWSKVYCDGRDVGGCVDSQVENYIGQLDALQSIVGI